MSLRSRGSFARTSGGLREVDGSYDLYVLCGLYGIGMALALYASHRTDSHKIDKHCFLVSENEFEKVLTDRLGSHPAYKLAAKFRRAFAKPVFLVPLPCFADTATQTRPALKATAESGDGVSLGRIFAQATVAAASEGIRPLPQPDKTVSGGIFTQARFSSGSARLWNGELHEEADYAHMNGDYGEIVMRAIIGAAERSP